MTSTIELSDRRKAILRTVVRRFIESAMPVASEHLARNYFVDLSPATIRNELAGLEEQGFVDHPHTSAGRIPTDLGYRAYVDSLMMIDPPTESEKRTIQHRLESAAEVDELLREMAKTLGRISHQVVAVSFPHFMDSALNKLELISLSSSRILVILTMKSKLVKTITMEVAAEIRREKLEGIAQTLNERLAGLTLREIRATIANRVRDIVEDETGLIRLFIYSRNRLFDDQKERERLCISGTQNMTDQPEFQSPIQFKNIMELLDNEDIIVHVLEESEDKAASIEASVIIGKEHKNQKLYSYSFVVSRYSFGDVYGSIGIFGPKRMDYARAVPLVNYAAQTLSEFIS